MTLHLHQWGEPSLPPVVCLHGVVAHGRRFRRLAEERLRGFHVVAPDLRGHGRSTWEPPWTILQHVEDVCELLGERGIERAAFVGHSFGGRLTLELTARGLVERSVLLDPAVWVPPPLAFEHAEAHRPDRSWASVDDAIDVRGPTARLAPRDTLEEEMREHLVLGDDGRWRFRYSQAAVITAYGELSQPPPEWELVRVPTLMVVGAESEVVPEPMVEAVRDGLREHVEVVTVPGGHIPLWDAYDETAAAIERFLVL